MKKLIFICIILGLAFVLFAPQAVAKNAEKVAKVAKVAKVEICHRTFGDNEYVPITISVNAYETHINHGDVSPGDAVEGEGKFGTVFGADCSEIPPDAFGDNLIWTNASGSLVGLTTSFWVNGSETDAGTGTAVLTRPDGTGYTIEVACVRFNDQDNEVNWGGWITTSDEEADIGKSAVGWAWDNPNGPDMIGFWKNGFSDPCSNAALEFTGGGTVTSGEVIITQ